MDWSTRETLHKNMQVAHLAHGLVMPTCVVGTMYGKNIPISTNQFY